ncbi:MAG TPA: MBL fold metallo-hydrolase [Candidatus Paceibacterota bacterium]
MNTTLTFCGGAGSVTGANFLLESGEAKFLIDCGSAAQELVCDPINLEAFPYDPSHISALLVTHAHQDHIGRIPKLVRDGFRGQIHSTSATRDLSAVMLDDALHVLEMETAEHGCEALYDGEDVERARSLWQGHEYHAPFSIGDTTFDFFDAGHILGSALIRVSRGNRSIVFSGDIGNSPEPLLRDTEIPEESDYLLVESVYGDRLHEDRAQRREVLRNVIRATHEKKGTLLIPSFSLERTQVLLFEIHTMIEAGEIEPIHIYMDSPLAARVTAIFRSYPALFNDAARARLEKGEDLFAFEGLTIVGSTAQSRAIHSDKSPKVIIAGAGMSAGGRVRAHELQYLDRRDTTLLFVGYQAPGTLGRRIQEGAKKVRIEGREVHVRATIETVTGYSGHADRDQLMDFIERAGRKTKKVFVTMGEPRASLFLAQRIHDFFGIEAYVPQKGERVELDF